jgi:hypothetical protein
MFSSTVTVTNGVSPTEETMVFAFDTLSFARHLREHGVPQDQAEAHAEAARQFIMAELVTKQDLTLALDNLKLSLTMRLGAMLFLAVGALAAILKLT